MGLRIKTNVVSLNARRRVGENQSKMQDSLEKLSSGQRINKAADDAAGLAISEQMKARIASVDAAKRNTNDAVSYIQSTEGNLSELSNILVRMRELATQAASDTLGAKERSYLDKEFQQLKQEVVRITNSAEYNGRKTLQVEDSKPLEFYVGVTGQASDVISVSRSDLTKLSESLEYFTEDGFNIVEDSDGGGARDLSEYGTQRLFNILDDAINSVSAYRATLGATESRLNSVITHLDVTNENLQAAQSRIRDVDYAEEISKMAMYRILSQASVSVLTQANQYPEQVITLLNKT